MKPIHVSNLEAMIGRWQAQIIDAEKLSDHFGRRGNSHGQGEATMKAATIRGCISDLRTEIQREQDRQVELEGSE